MSQGIGASNYRKGWVGQAMVLLQAEGKQYAVINLSKSGAGIENVLNEQLPMMRALGGKPAIITVLVGSNDLLAFRRRRKILINLRELLNQLPEGAIVGNIFDRPKIPAILKSLFENRRASNLLAERGHQRKLTIVPIGEAFALPWRGKLAADFFHPNDTGYEAIARLFVDAILKKG